MSKEISLCTERCKSCQHRTNVTGMIHGEGNIACAYIIDTHQRRGCPAGDKCDKYAQGKTVRRFRGDIKEKKNVYL